jgi:hypothetical protein
LSAQPDPVSNAPKTTTKVSAATIEFETPQRATAVIQSGEEEEEKKDQDSPSVPVVSAKQEETETAVVGSSVSSDKPAKQVKENESEDSIPVPIPKDDDKGNIESVTEKEHTPPLVSSSNNTSDAAQETPAPGIAEYSSVAPTSDGTSEDKAEPEKLNPVQNTTEEASSTTSTTTAVAVTFEDAKQPKQATASNLLSTLTKPPQTNRFSGFKSMAGNIAAKGAERVAKVKDQIQKEEDGQNTNANANNRFAGFKNIAGTMAAKGAERVAKVKDQIQKEDTDGNRFAGLKSMAAKGAERVAKVKDQIQKEDTDGQNINAKRLAGGFKSITEKIAAKSAERVAKVKDQIQHSSHGLKTNSSHGSKKSSHGSKTAVAAKAAPSPASSVTAPESSPQTPTATMEVTDTNPPTNPSILPSTPITATNDTPRDSEGSAPTKEVPPPKEPVATDTETSEADNASGGTGTNATVEPERPENNEESTLQSQAQDISSTPHENNSIETNANANANDVAESIDSTNSAAQKSSNVDAPTSDGTKSPKTAVRVESDKSGEESTSVPPQSPATVVNDTSKEEHNSATPPAKDSSVKSKPEKTQGMDSSSEKMEAGSSKSNNSNKDPLTPNPTAPKGDTKTFSSEPTASTPTAETENSTDTNPVETSNNPQPQQTPSKTLQSSPPTQGTSVQVEVLQKELHAAHTLIMQLQHHENVEEERPGDAVMVELQANLQKEMIRRAEAEEKARFAVSKSKRIEEEYTTFKTVSKANLDKMTTSVESLQANLQKETTRRSEAEEKARVAVAKSKQIEEEYTTFKTVSKANLDEMTTSVESLTQEKNATENEVVEIREERDEQARKEMALTTRLNAAKKKEAVKANAAEHYGDQVDQLEFAVEEYESQVESLTAERDQLKVELGEWKEYAEKRTKQLETALNDEKKLNDERKRKMKGFVEAKTEEVRSAKADYISLQTEMDQNSHSLTELNQRYKQLHAQWVQSQTRNRELQRDAMKMKKDSEKMHKVGGSLEARLSRSAQESEDHKNKRLHARNELMSVLAQLEAERTVNSRLQESIKMTFTPKALSQQHTIHEALDEFEAALQKLSTRIGRPLPPTFSKDPDAFDDKESLVGGSSQLQENENGDTIDIDESINQGTVTLSEINTNRAVQKLENETQRVSQNIMKFSASIERMHSLLDGGGTKNCVDVLSQMLLMSGNTTPAIAAANPTRKSSGSQRYGQISSNTR